MMKNYLKVALRNLFRRKTNSILNLFGLASGLACCILIVGFVYNELSFDRYHENASRIYRITSEILSPGNTSHMATTSAPLAAELRQNIPEIEKTVRFFPGSRTLIKYENKEFFEENYLYADASVFGIFEFRLVKGNPENALVDPLSAVLTRETAKKYFGEADPIGKSLNLGNAVDFVVTGVIEDLPPNSHFKFDMLLSFETLYSGNSEYMARRGNFRYYTYLLLRENIPLQQAEKKLTALAQAFFNLTDEQARNFRFVLQPLTSIHMHSHLERELAENSDITYVYIFSVIALFILLIAIINFTNLATAHATGRSLEIGVRKMAGARKENLVLQFLGESMIYSMIALVVAFVLVELALPHFTRISGRNLQIDYFNQPWLTTALFGLALMAGFLAGSYPAFFLAKFPPVRALSRALTAGGAGVRFRQVLVVTQFTISIALVICSLIVVSQLRFMKNKKLGFTKEQVAVVPIDSRVVPSISTIKTELRRFDVGLSVAASSHVPGLFYNSYSYLPEGSEKSIQMKLINIDHDFIPTLGMEMAAGRNFSPDFPADHEGSVLINETAARLFGWENPVGKKIVHNYGQGDVTRTVVGVVKDFHFESLHDTIEPVYMSNETDWLRTITIRVNLNNARETLEFLKTKWHEMGIDRPFDYFFLDESFESQYKSDERISVLFNYFTAFAIFVACLGLFAMASFTTEQRTKEIGIRKVVGARVAQIVLLLSKETLSLIVPANLLAWPIAWFAMGQWLQDFAYRIDMSVWIFAVAGVTALVIALITVSTQAVRAALANPVESLRYE